MKLVEQAEPQSPQFVTVRMFVSQPSNVLLLLQSPKPVLQVPSHTKLGHVEAMLVVGHTAPQLPQLADVAKSVSHPSVSLSALQSE
jgi:hypothetical protein